MFTGGGRRTRCRAGGRSCRWRYGRGTGGRGGGAPAAPRIDHACMSMDSFVPDAVIKALASYGIKPSENEGRSGGPMTS